MTATMAAAALGLFGFAGAATAAPPANIDTEADTSLTIHKLVQPDVDGADAPIGIPNASGEAVDITGLGLVPVQGVQYTVQEITAVDGDAVDLTTTEGWNTIQSYVEAYNADGTLPAPITTSPVAGSPFTTNASGEITINNTDGAGIGFYLVTETDVTGAKDGNTGDPLVISSKHEPFIVTVPMPGTTPGTWNYNVHVYPKNPTVTAEKSVDETGALALGDTVTWTIEADIPFASPNSDGLTKYRIIDQLPAEVVYSSSSVSVVDKTGAAVAVSSPADYTIDAPAVDANGTVTLAFTDPAGLAKLDGAQGGTVTLDIVTKVVSIPDSGNIVNGGPTIDGGAYVEIDEAEIPVTEEIEWGGLEITKVVAGDTSKVLAGAEFQIYATQADAEAGSNPISVLVGGVTGTETTTFVTGDDGKVTIPGLKAGTYYLKETKAPAGYTASTTVYPVEIKAGETTNISTQQVENVQKPPTTTPPLGAAGIVGITLGGLALVGGGVALAVAQRRKNAVHNA